MMLRKFWTHLAKKKKQRNCKHKDLTIVASDPEHAFLYCYDCGKEWVEKT